VNVNQYIARLGHNSQRVAVEHVPIDRLKRNARNPRDHKEKQLAKLAKSIARFGFLVPCIIDDDNRVLAGNARVAAAARLGFTEVPAIRIRHLTEAEMRAFVVADNKLTELATWNEAILREELQFFAELDIDFDFSAIGFETAEVDIILDDATGSKDDDLTVLRSGRPAVSRLGDLWVAGLHHIYCGDALASGSYKQLLGTARAQLVFTDVPYNVPISGHVCGSGAVQHREFEMASGEMTSAAFTEFLIQGFKNMAHFSVDGSIHYACIDWRHLPEILAAAAVVYSDFKNLCVWTKTNSGMGSFYRSQHELVAVFKNGTAPHINNINLGVHGRNRSNVWPYAGINSFGRHRDELLAIHPTVKPVALVADAIKDASARGDLVLDPFAGSGTTLIAAEKTRRRAAVMEIDPLYVDAIVRRWEAFTGKEAVCASTGATFAEREAETSAAVNNSGEQRE
jgi:DNA modification methylase